MIVTPPGGKFAMGRGCSNLAEGMQHEGDISDWGASKWQVCGRKGFLAFSVPSRFAVGRKLQQ